MRKFNGVSLAVGGALMVAAGLGASAAIAAPITFTASVGNRAASVEFTTSGTNLIVRLTNTSAADVLEPKDVLTAVFWNFEGSDPTLTRTSAVVPGTSTVLFGGTDAGGVVGGEWAYLAGIGGPEGTSYGISSAGFGIFGAGDRFPGTDLSSPASPDGLNYGITSASDNPATGNAPVTGDNPLIKNEVVFTLGSLPGGYNPATKIKNVWWQYGTKLDEPRIPEPMTLVLIGAGGLLLARRRS